MWGMGIGSILLLAVSVTVSSCDVGASTGLTENNSSGIHATAGSSSSLTLDSLQ